MADTTPRKRASVISSYKHTELDQKNIAESLKMSRATVCQIIKQFNATGFVTPQRKKCGRKKNTSPRDDALILRESKKNP